MESFEYKIDLSYIQYGIYHKYTTLYFSMLIELIKDFNC